MPLRTTTRRSALTLVLMAAVGCSGRSVREIETNRSQPPVNNPGTGQTTTPPGTPAASGNGPRPGAAPTPVPAPAPSAVPPAATSQPAPPAPGSQAAAPPAAPGGQSSTPPPAPGGQSSTPPPAAAAPSGQASAPPTVQVAEPLPLTPAPPALAWDGQSFQGNAAWSLAPVAAAN